MPKAITYYHYTSKHHEFARNKPTKAEKDLVTLLLCKIVDELDAEDLEGSTDVVVNYLYSDFGRPYLKMRRLEGQPKKLEGITEIVASFLN